MSRLKRAPLLALLVAIVGCSGQDKWEAARPAVYEGTGEVRFDGEAVKGAKINFHPQEGGTHSAYAVTDEEGVFALTTFNPGDGAVAGEYVVTISKQGAYIVPNPENPEIFPPLVFEKYSLLPENYAVPEESDLKATVSDSGENTYVFDLKGSAPPMSPKIPKEFIEGLESE